MMGAGGGQVMSGVAFVIVTATTADPDGAYADDPPYAAVTLCVPAVSDATWIDAVPPARGTAPSDVAPSENVIVPVASAGLTVAVNVIIVPNTAFVVDAERLVVVGPAETLMV